ncbi:MAG: ATP-binding cassette domain-containing protein, partial [Acetobacteraceae bacterium]|nr:ATP-binding cassette domain-containing protein [Acetobacteraceae bacterium]
RQHGLRLAHPRPAPSRNPPLEQAADQLELGALLSRKPRQLSGDQRQRVAMGRAIVREPRLFLFDELLSNLDARLRVQMRGEIRRLQSRLGITTHDRVEAMTLGDRLLILNNGRAAQLATPMDVFERPADTFVAGFIGSPAMNFLSGTLTRGGTAAQLDAGPVIPLPTRHATDGHRIILGIRPEHLEPAPDGITITIDLVKPLGSETVTHGGSRPASPSPCASPAGPRLRITSAFAPLRTPPRV